ncbi:MAG: DUF1501 domain-containing protein [Planctomycetales bacterium]
MRFPLSRREMLASSSSGFGMLALAGLCSDVKATSTATAPVQPHFPAKAKRVIFLCMRGGPSHMESFDHKPKLSADNGKPTGKKGLNYFGSQWKFSQHGESGIPVSSLFPHTAEVVDDLCILNGMHTDNPEHGAALTQLHTGSFLFERPSIGSWVLYGLGTENRDLPGFVTVKPPVILGGARNYGNAFLPSVYQGTPIGTMSKALKLATIANTKHPTLTIEKQRKQLDLLQSFNRDLAAQQQSNDQIEGVIESFELAFRMQTGLPSLMDFSGETQSTLDAYGIGDKLKTDDFGRQCLLARKLAENDVRFIELTHDNWDHHGFVSRLMPQKSFEIDQPMAALLTDLKQRGLLEDTLVIWGGEFGRTPDDPRGDGRGHQPQGFTMWMAGGGVKPGTVYGATDEYGYKAVEGRVHVHDLHATILHLLGLDHTQLTYRYAGRDFRLTDVYGRVVSEIIA